VGTHKGMIPIIAPMVSWHYTVWCTYTTKCSTGHGDWSVWPGQQTTASVHTHQQRTQGRASSGQSAKGSANTLVQQSDSHYQGLQQCLVTLHVNKQHHTAESSQEGTVSDTHNSSCGASVPQQCSCPLAKFNSGHWLQMLSNQWCCSCASPAVPTPLSPAAA